jgi:hypothetical protein
MALNIRPSADADIARPAKHLAQKDKRGWRFPALAAIHIPPRVAALAPYVSILQPQPPFFQHNCPIFHAPDSSVLYQGEIVNQFLIYYPANKDILSNRLLL